MTNSTGTTIKQLDRRIIEAYLVGESGIYFNSMSAKSMRDLLLPPKKKTAAEKANSLKHDPRAEFRRSIYTNTEDDSTHLGFPAAGVKAAMASAALVTEGLKKSDVQKLLFVEGENVPIFGIPSLRCDVVRSADIARTPDVRTRAFVPRWAMRVRISYVSPNLTADGVTNLLANAGQTCGIGDFRQEKGRGNFGRWRVVNKGDAEFADIQALATAEDQRLAMNTAQPFDEISAEMLSYFDGEVEARELIAAE